MSKQELASKLKEYAESLGAELYGIASANLYAEKYPDKPKPHQFVENAKSIIVIGLPFEPGTIKTVLKPDLAALKSNASDKVTDDSSTAVGAEGYFLSEERDIMGRELALMAYKIAKFLRKNKWNAFHLPVGKQWKNVYACASYGCCGTCMAICPVGEI